LAPKPLARRGLLNLIAIAAASAALTVAAGMAWAGTGGFGIPDPPKVTDVHCIETCAGLREATTGSRVELSGRYLKSVAAVRFPAAGGDHVDVAPTRVAGRFVRAKVPDTARSGTPKVIDDAGNREASPAELTIVAPDEIPEAGNFRVAEARVSPKTSFFDAKRDPTLTYAFEGTEADVRVEVVDRDSGKVVRSWVQRGRKPFVDHRVRWDGRREGGGLAQIGQYRFRIGAMGGARARSADGSGFRYYDHIFPVRARHAYGDGFGAGRGHEGQDVFARCGAPIVAARGGTVSWKQYQAGGAGNYVVIDGRHDKHDYMYAHLRQPASVREGEHVRTDQRIGRVGQTGNASGCHLHFEYWSAHWYAGGSPLSTVTRVLRKWDGWS
jgi:murein DD-endopeptidase MepM/ murein hydrolase activator NlpD